MSMYDYMKTPESTPNPYAQGEPVKKPGRPWLKYLRLIFEAVLVLTIIFLLTNGDDAAESASDPGTDSSATQEVTEEPAPAAAPAFPGAEPGDVVGESGDSLELEGVAITATALVDGDISTGSYPTLCTTTTLVNNSDATVAFDTFAWNLQTPAGVINYTTHYGSKKLLIGAGKIAPGGTTSGDVCFPNEIPETGQYVLLYTPDRMPPDYEDPEGRGAWISTR